MKKEIKNGERVSLKSMKVIESYDTNCKHKWEYIKRWFRGDILICKKCGGFKLI